MTDLYIAPLSPREEIQGMVYFIRLCSKARLKAAGKLHPDFHPNLGKAMDLWTCQFLHVEYDALLKVILETDSDLKVLEWCWEHGVKPNENELKWWNSFMRNVGFRDDLTERLIARKVEAGWEERDDIQTFFDYLDADDGRM